MATLKYVLIILEVLLLFNLLIGVHELGHFLAAKWRGLKIDRFAIWFGKPIWKRRIGGVEYAFGWIPAGGYVALPQMASMEAIEGKSDSPEQQLPNISPLDKIIVAFAGPLFSFLLAIFFAVVVWIVGKPVNTYGHTTYVGWVESGGPADKAGLRAGDRIVSIDNFPVKNFFSPSEDSVKWRVITSAGTNITIQYERDGQEFTTSAVPHKQKTKWYERRALRQLSFLPALPFVIGDIATNSPAALAGLKEDDEIVALDGEKVFHPIVVFEAVDRMSNAPVRPLTLTIRRGMDEFDQAITPARPIQPTNSNPLLGIMSYKTSTNMALVHPKPMDQIKESTGQIVATLRALFGKGDIGPGHLGGAVMIINVYTKLFASEEGWRLVLWFSVVLNVNLALLNLLPFPVLDGGHITLAVVESIRRRPVSARLLQYVQTACALLLIGFMIFIAFFDAGDWIRSREGREQAIVFEAPR